MFERAEILFVCTAHTGLARMAEGAASAQMRRAGLGERYKLTAAMLATDLLPAAGESRVRDELGNSYVFHGQTLLPQQVNEADLIVAMSQAEKRALLDRFPGACGKVKLLSEMAGPVRDVTGVEAVTSGNLSRLCRDVQQLVEHSFDALLNRAEAGRARTMARVGFSTGVFHYEFVRPSIDEILAMIAQVGAPYAEFSWNIGDNHLYTAGEIDQIAASFEAHHLQCQQVHGFENTEAHALSEGEGLDRYVAVQSSLIELCGRLGGDTLVVHLPGLWWTHLKLSLHEAMERSTVAMDRLRPLCEELGVRLAVENYQEQDSVQRFEFYLERYPASFVGCCIDCGHANLVKGEMQGVKAFGSRLCALHLHDNHGENDDHQPPFFGSIDWEDLMHWLVAIGYDRCLNFELLYDRLFCPQGPVEFFDYATRRVRQLISLAPQTSEVTT